MKKVCIVGISGKLGRYMAKHAIDKGYDVVGVCREQSAHKLQDLKDKITLHTGKTNDRDVIKKAVNGCDGVLTVLAPWGIQKYSSGTAQAVLDYADNNARLVFSCGWHISKDGKDRYKLGQRLLVKVFSVIAKAIRFAELDDQVEACRRIFDSDRAWTVVRCSDIEEGDSEGVPVWSDYVQDPILESNITRRVDFALFMIHCLENDGLIKRAPAIVSCKSESAIRHSKSIL